MARRLLIVEDESTLRESLERLFIKNDYDVSTAGSAEDALALLEKEYFDVVISDIILPGIDGIEMLTRIREHDPTQTVIVMTAYASLDTAVRALRLGAYDYIMKPIMHEEIRQTVANSIKHKQLERENVLLKRQIQASHDFTRVIGNSPRLKAVLAEADKVSDTRSTILLLGETGTGKELMARVIHENSSRSHMPFVPINCAAIPENLLESELFGHAKGSFTGAAAAKVGLFEEADGGTVFLDEIGEMPNNFQVKLLRVLEDFEVRPVGSTRTRKVDIRFITATNRDLSDSVAKGEFREDLFYRINVISLLMPPLRDRKEDIPALASHFVAKYSAICGRPVREFSEEALSALISWRWPGNIRELQNVIERAILISESPRIEASDLPPNILRTGLSFVDDSLEKTLSIDDYTRTFVAKYQHACSEQDLADMLGITRKTLWEKRKKWGIKRS